MNDATDQLEKEYQEMADAILVAVAALSHPMEKLRLLVQHGLVAEVARLVRALVREGRLDLTLERSYDVLRIFKDDHLILPERGRDITVYLLYGSHDPHDNMTYRIGLEGLREFCGWSEQATARFLKPIVERIIEQDPGFDCWLLRDRRDAMERLHEYFHDDSRLGRQMEICRLRMHLRTGRLFEIRGTTLRPEFVYERHPDNARRELDPVIDRLVTLGWIMKQVREEILAVMCHIVKDCRLSFMLALAGAKCFHTEADGQERNTLLREQYRAYAWDNLVEYGRIIDFCHLLECGLRPAWDSPQKETDQSWYRERFLDLLAAGKLTTAWQLLRRMGHKLRFYHDESGESRDRHARSYFLKLIPEAFQHAYTAERYGLAAAMVETFGKSACCTETTGAEWRERVDSVTQLAIVLSQPIRATDFFSYYFD